jgi:hypothetical protein
MKNIDRKQQRRYLWETLVSIRRFGDDSSIMYFAEGGRQINFIPYGDEPLPVPMAYLYYWQVERNRPDVTTWEQIKQAEKTSRSESFNDR